MIGDYWGFNQALTEKAISLIENGAPSTKKAILLEERKSLHPLTSH